MWIFCQETHSAFFFSPFGAIKREIFKIMNEIMGTKHHKELVWATGKVIVLKNAALHSKSETSKDFSGAAAIKQWLQIFFPVSDGTIMRDAISFSEYHNLQLM